MLYIVATPIGNLSDMTYRAVETLKNADLIACEDTRRSLKLLNYYEIKKPLIAYHKFNERKAAEKLLDELRAGKTIALITDAGMPVISDPGNVLIKTLIEEGLQYTVLPGACALVNALVLSGFDALRFVFAGFLPEKKKDCTELLEKLKLTEQTLIFYCAPHDIKMTVEKIYEVLGDRKACAVREITKIHESVEPFSLKDGYEKEPRGEYVLIVEGKPNENPLNTLSEREHVEHYIASGLSKTDALKQAAKDRKVPKNTLYKYFLNEETETDEETETNEV